MDVLSIISKKRDGCQLLPDEIKFLVDGYHRGEVPDYQMAAFLMATYIRGLNDTELRDYTSALLHSGKIMQWESLGGVVADKHSSGGVGDKTSLVVGPLLAAAGCYFPKMSGRGLGHTGGTIDQRESRPGLKTELSPEELYEQVKRIGVAVVSQTEDLAPADGKIYALRDVTATVESIPLIAASIMSKKLAGGAHGVVLDVKVGSGAFIKTIEEARRLARTMVELGTNLGQKARALISDMNSPLGYKTGNLLELEEVLDVLQGKGPENVRRLSLTLAALLLHDLGKAGTRDEAFRQVEKLLDEGKALKKFQDMVQAQGGNFAAVEKGVPREYLLKTETAKHDGIISKLDALHLGRCAALLGAGRFRKGEAVDPYAGVELHVTPGQEVVEGQPVLSMYSGSCTGRMLEAENEIASAYGISKEIPLSPKFIHEIL